MWLETSQIHIRMMCSILTKTAMDSMISLDSMIGMCICLVSTAIMKYMRLGNLKRKEGYLFHSLGG